ncbi:uncharacterized protein TNCV_4741361 [Trichonephila clavipes]|nr:uncharacterized protein TNCV_4741361 [Trichonephila clavipes]
MMGMPVEILLMTANRANTDFVNHPVPSTSELSTSLVEAETDSCESIINSILPCKDYDSHKNATLISKSDSLIILSITGVRICDRLFGLELICERLSAAEHKNILPQINLKDIVNHMLQLPTKLK